MHSDELPSLALRAGNQLRQRGDTVAVAEGSAGGLISAALLAVPGASACYLGGVVVYPAAAYTAWLVLQPRMLTRHEGAPPWIAVVEAPARMRGATEPFALNLAQSAAAKLGTTWGIGEAGAAGPSNPYGDPAGHCWVAVAGPNETTRHILIGIDDRPANMVTFAVAALAPLSDTLDKAPTP